MPEIKHTFAVGKMDKDIDERLVKNGEYRDALNIQVRTTDGDASGVGDAGTVQNIKGNVQLATAYETISYYDEDEDGVNEKTKIIGSIGDESNDRAFFFAAAPIPSMGIEGIEPSEIIAGNGDGTKVIWVDSIIEVKVDGDDPAPIFVDRFAVTGVVSDIMTEFPTTFEVADGYTSLVVTDGADYRVGMIVMVQDSNGNHLLTHTLVEQEVDEDGNITSPAIIQDGVEITKIIGNTLILESEQTSDLETNASVMKFIHKERVLQFDYNELITSISIVDDLLFWVDGKINSTTGELEGNEPKKINTKRSKAGTTAANPTLSGYLANPKHTKLYVHNPNTNDLAEVTDVENLITSDIKREHITVIRKAPVSPPTLTLRENDRELDTFFTISYNFVNNDITPNIPIEDTIRVITVPSTVEFRINDIFKFTSMGNTDNPAVIRAKIDNIENVNQVSFRMLYVSDEVAESNPSTWEVELEQKKALFETKFGRFAYRYQYEDNEYSSFSPWSELAFIPGRFSYTPSKGHNEGMANNVRQLIIKDFIPHDTIRPSDVKTIDILWKTTDSANVYLIKSITRERNSEWELFTDTLNDNTGSMTITSEMIHRVLPANQTLRGWDNVPRKIRAQEITANRLIFGNYIQGYDIETPVGLKQSIISTSINFPYPQKSIKAIRDYKFGMVFGDKYGRETPVIANAYKTAEGETITGDLSIEKSLAHYSNKFKLKQSWEPGEPMDWMYYVKYYVKETSNEYYNLVLDRWYDAGDGNVWLAFASVDRNKIDEETYLILKNEHGSHDTVTERARYKVIAIENSAPDFIKTDYRGLEKVEIDQPNVYGASDISDAVPSILINNTKILTNFWEASGIEAKDFKGTPNVRIVGYFNSATDGKVYTYSPWKVVTRIVNTDVETGVIIRDVFTTTEANMYQKIVSQLSTPSELTQANVDNEGNASYITYYIELRDAVVENKPQFDGRFFVKIEKDNTLKTRVLGTQNNYEVTDTYEIAYIAAKITNPAISGDQSAFTWPDTDFAFTSSDIESTVAISDINPNVNAPSTSVPAFGPGNTTLTENFWNAWYNQKSTNIFIDEAPAYSGFQYIDSLINIIAQAAFDGLYDFWSQVNGIPDTVDTEEGFNETYGPAVNNVITNNSGMTWPEWDAYLQDQLGIPQPTADLFSLFGNANNLSNFSPDSSPISLTSPAGLIWQGGGFGGTMSNDNWRPPGLSAGSALNGELGQLTLSVIGDNWAGDDGTFKAKMQTPGTKFRFPKDPQQVVYEITSFSEQVIAGYPGFEDPITIDSENFIGVDGNGQVITPQPDLYKRYSIITRFARLDSNGVIIPNSGIDINNWDPRGEVQHNGVGSLSMEMLLELDIEDLSDSTLAVNAACWETEPKEDVGLDIYYEASGSIPIRLKNKGDTLLLTSARLNRDRASRANLDPRTLKTLDSNLNPIKEQVVLSGFPWPYNIFSNDCIEIQHTNDSGIITKLVPQDGVGVAIDDIIYFRHKDGLVTRTKILDHYDINTVTLPGQGTGNTPVLSTRYNVTGGMTTWPFLTSIFFATGGLDNINIGMEVTGPGIEKGTFVTAINTSPDEGSPNVIISRNIVQTAFVGFGEFDTQTNATFTFIDVTGYYKIDKDVWKYPVDLGWFNCYSFGNGVESDRIRDDFNAPQIDNGVKVSATFIEYGEETIGSGLIYSGLYNSTSGVNDLNEFNMAEKITKSLNPIYGSIQALKTSERNLTVFSEDKVLKVLANKDAVYNADGNPQLVATNRVLGDATPYVGDYGISQNPESLAWDNYRMYFTDKQRGAVLRLSGDGLTPTSDVGMRTYFRERLKLCKTIVGNFDSVNGEYNITLNTDEKWTQGGTTNPPTTVSFNEKSKGWVSFKSFIPLTGVSVSGKYLTANANKVWEHYDDNALRNNFYGTQYGSEIEVVFNDSPDSIKSFKAINYEGSQSKITAYTGSTETDAAGNTATYNDGEYYNLTSKTGWYIDSFNTDLQEGKVPEFINKEGKWFNKINGVTTDLTDTTSSYNNFSEFSVQGLGVVTTTTSTPPEDATLTIQDTGDTD